jgi:hypothetical protein
MARQNLPMHGSFAHHGEASTAYNIAIKLNGINSLCGKREMARPSHS